MNVLLVALGAALGAPLRLLVSRAIPGARATLAVNVVGSWLLGLVAGTSTSTYALVGIGFCGALTTFSTFALEAVDLGSGDGPRQRLTWTAAYSAVTVCACLAAAALGLAMR
jgi:CrcB protein